MSDQMPTDNLRFSNETIQALINSLNQEIELLQGSKGKLEATTTEVMAGWQGQAGSRFGAGQQEANLNLDRLIRSLENLRGLVEMSRNDFDDLEQQQLDDMLRAQSGLANINSSGFENLA
ncbi:WXG100 family type VII secretion target [Streptomyces sp. PT12]|uniref:WXG100 family type VII secretion target n=1 Tax=Streptomyces sp. PT12 TaxID=1510197 RepID=UPI000DE3F234|nr:WXG100 family type VII secretion target [Streptomyces sp. PT12]RBM05085.1 hypothetical protein DEH69_28975 [Streptomyces sp. PT12]